MVTCACSGVTCTGVHCSPNRFHSSSVSFILPAAFDAVTHLILSTFQAKVSQVLCCLSLSRVNLCWSDSQRSFWFLVSLRLTC